MKTMTIDSFSVVDFEHSHFCFVFLTAKMKGTSKLALIHRRTTRFSLSGESLSLFLYSWRRRKQQKQMLQYQPSIYYAQTHRDKDREIEKTKIALIHRKPKCSDSGQP